MPARTLDDPPPITPAKLRNWPYAVSPFPFETLAADAGLLKGAPASVPAGDAAERVE